MTKTQQIENKIRELCPELMKLTEGCEVFNEQVIEDESGAYHDLGGVIIDTDDHNNVCVRNFAGKMSDDYQIWMDKSEVQEIIGHPIQLSHLLRATSLSVNGWDGKLFNCDCNCPIGNIYSFLEDNKDIYFDLTKSVHQNLEENKELREFIYNLLVKE